MAGRKPKPTKLHILNGNPSRKKLDTNEPTPDIVIPNCPNHLSELGKLEWYRITKEFKKLGLISEIDMAGVASYCQLYGRWVELENAINEEDNIIAGRINPKIVESRLTLQQLRSYLTEFGMTPSARARLSINLQSGETDPMEKLLNNVG